MHKYSIKKVLEIPDYKGVKNEKNKETIKIWIEPYKTKQAKCGKCGKHHKKGCYSLDLVKGKRFRYKW